MKRKVLLVVMDGWGIAPSSPGNCITQAKTPNLDRLSRQFPFTQLNASGNAVGLPAGVQGNSEVGHLHMGAGRIVWQPFERVNREISNGTFFSNPILLQAIRNAIEKKTTLHLMGLCSDAGVHSHLRHLLALIEMAQKNGNPRTVIHFFSDGRDVGERTASTFIREIEKMNVPIASICGRYYSMDRDNNWERTRKAYELLVNGTGLKSKSPAQAIQDAYARGETTDYFIAPTAIMGPNEKSLAIIQDNDSVIFFNFRTDRPRQLARAFIDPAFTGFPRTRTPRVHFCTLTPY
ncbi:MAG: phosphoglycerate mutase (2,3-diphosphoglycerate-independent), partial [Candidatus Diapherotrites archaeon]|nr:phosphoglycerate mutase (2,3-diphosphoglycerate-independent) [Candidatus Diapherotrites archaeon]